MNDIVRVYVRNENDINVRAAPSERDWMDKSPERYAYRCLPLAIANAHGWEILLESGFQAIWNGGSRTEDIQIWSENAARPAAISHFGCGIVTFHIPCLIRTEANSNLFVSGPTNRSKHGISALTGVIETDWSPYGFTMNWQFTAPNQKVTFVTGEPICSMFPVDTERLKNTTLEIRNLATEPELERAHNATGKTRNQFLKGLSEGDQTAVEQKWQKTYFQGRDSDGVLGKKNHLTKLRLKTTNKFFK